MSSRDYRPYIIVTGPKRGLISRFFIKLALFLAGAKSKIITPNSINLDIKMDALLISGGDDLYNAFIQSNSCQLDDIINYERDVLEYRFLNRAIKEKKPVMGICRGYQLINIFFGGTLYEDIRKEGYRYRYTPLAWKYITLEEDGVLSPLIKKSKIKINTLHHQAVKDIAPNFSIEALDKYNIIQAISKRDKDNLFFGVQWHPEYLFFKRNHLKLFKLLVESAKDRA